MPAVALAVLVPTVLRLPVPVWSGTYVFSAMLWATLVAIAETSPLSLPGRDLRLRLTPLFAFGALLTFGTVPAAGLVAIGCAIGARVRRFTWSAAALGAAQSALIVAISGAVYFDQGGVYGHNLVAEPIHLPALVLAMAAFALSSAALESWRHAAGEIWGIARARGGAVRSQLILGALVLPLGVAFAWLEGTSGPMAAACAVVLVMMTRGVEPEPAQTQLATLQEAPESQRATVRLLMSAIDAFDPFTRGHAGRIAHATVRVARHMGVTGQSLEQIEYGALFHDIGRTAIRLDVLTRPGALDAQERAALQTHPTVGYEIVRTLPGMEQAAEIVYTHHEQPDGRGYPRGLEADRIPVGARIITVAAAFESMTHERPYRRGLAPATAYEELRRHAGTQFFADVVEAFITLHQSGTLDRESDDPNERLFTPNRDGDSRESMAA